MESWLPISADCHFSLQNLPYGVFSVEGQSPRIGTAIGDYALDLKFLSEEHVFDDLEFDTGTLQDTVLNRFAALGKAIHCRVRKLLQTILTIDTRIGSVLRDHKARKAKALVPIERIKMHIPFQVTEYTDFFCGLHHAEICVDILMPGKKLEDVFPSFFDLPVGYAGRASSIVVSETAFHRPKGQINQDGRSVASETLKLDFEAELGAFVSHGNLRGESIAIETAEDHIFGVVLLNDWSARDIQSWECQLLGPLNGKNFCTSVSPWVVPLEALEPWRTATVSSDQPRVNFIQNCRADPIFNIPIRTSIEVNSESYFVSESNTSNLVFSLPQMLVHHTRGGCPMRTGDLIGTGTLSGPHHGESGCLLEMCRDGEDIISLHCTSGETLQRTFLEDGDTVVMSALLKSDANPYGNVGFGTLKGKVLAPVYA